ncbi:YjbQ family protein [candidate division KSB1 bacterium]|nr:YjbQ family protein [candidate division KSB1 bacterium]
MILIRKEFSIKSHSRVEVINIDHYIASSIQEHQINEGICTVFVPHTTAAVTINENADPDVMRDINMELNKIIPFADGYHHVEGNSAAHIKSTLVGASEQIFIEDGRLKLGTWQSVFFCEFDGPRTRKVWLQFMVS